MGKTRKTTAEKFDVLIDGEFYGVLDSWSEYLCLARNADGSLTLTSRGRQILAESSRYRERGWLPATIRRKDVWGFDGDYVVGTKLLLHDGDAEVTVSQNQFDVAAEWQKRRKWHHQYQFGEAWAQIRSLLYGPEFFSALNPRTLPPSAVADPFREEGTAGQAGGSFEGGDQPALSPVKGPQTAGNRDPLPGSSRAMDDLAGTQIFGIHRENV